MITIIKPGNTEHTVECPKCNCVFIYGTEDIQIMDKLEEDHQHYYSIKTAVINCPWCKHAIEVKS